MDQRQYERQRGYCSTPIDTGITASDVAGGDRDVLIVGKQVMIAGFDPYGDGKTGGARSTGLKGMVVSSDPTAVPVEPLSESTEKGLTTRTYNLPYAIESGGYVIYHSLAPLTVKLRILPSGLQLRKTSGSRRIRRPFSTKHGSPPNTRHTQARHMQAAKPSRTLRTHPNWIRTRMT